MNTKGIQSITLTNDFPAVAAGKHKPNSEPRFNTTQAHQAVNSSRREKTNSSLQSFFSVFNEELDKAFDSHLKTSGKEVADQFSIEILNPAESESKRPTKVANWYAKESSEHPGMLYEMGMDAEYAIALKFGDHPFAMVSCDINEDTILIKQIQAINLYKGYQPPDAGFIQPSRTILDQYFEGFRYFLVKALKIYGEQNGFNQLMIQSAENNHWVQQKHISLDYAKRVYNTTAEKMGFTLDPESSNYFLAI